MKIIGIVVTFFLFLLTGCGNDSKDLNVIVPNGAPALSQIFVDENQNNVNTTYVSGAQALQAAFNSDDYDFIYAPVNLGAKFYNNNAKYKLAAGVTFGNLYFATTLEIDFDIMDLNDYDVVLFGENTVNDMIIKTIFQINNLSPNVRYVVSVDDVKKEFLVDSNKIYLLAEPVLSALKQVTAKEVKILDCQTLYGENAYIQAAVFVNKNTISKDIKTVNKYLNALEKSCNLVNEDKDQAAKLAEKLAIGLPKKEVLVNAISGCNVRYLEGKSCQVIFEEMFKDNLGFIGNKLPDENFYY